MSNNQLHTQGPGEWVPTRDGRRLYAAVLPGPADARLPTVVFEAGSGASRSTWALVQTRVAEFSRSIAYDRSGLGRSPPDANGRGIARMADDLNDLLDHFGSGPYLLVGHSAGGPIVRLAASRQPQRIRGLVLVDPSDEACDALLSPWFKLAEQLFLPISLLLARLGLLRPLYRKLIAAMPAADVREDLRKEGFTPQVIRTQAAQARTFLKELAAWREHPPALGDIPLTLISGALPGDGMPAGLRQAANASHQARAASSPKGRHVLAPHSAHFVPLTDAPLIAEEIRLLISTC